jgi:hypothetical protein
MNKFLDVLKVIWQLPQVWLGAIILIINGYDETEIYKDKTIFYSKKFKSGISLGEVIILNTAYRQSGKTIKHEYGHSRQSMMLGPLYLLVVGLPSLTMNILTRMKVLKADRYYKRWPEIWADKLGGVKR